MVMKPITVSRRLVIDYLDEVMIPFAKPEEWYVISPTSILLLIEGALQGGLSDITVTDSVRDMYHTVTVYRGKKG